jgi:hypothetical protein
MMRLFEDAGVNRRYVRTGLTSPAFDSESRFCGARTSWKTRVYPVVGEERMVAVQS